MDQWKALNKSESNRLLILQSENYSISKIAKLLNRSHKVILNLLKDSKNYGKKKTIGQPGALIERQKRVLLLKASNFKEREIAKAAGVVTYKKCSTYLKIM